MAWPWSRASTRTPGAWMPSMLGQVPFNTWERRVYHALKQQLPSDWTVVCNVSWTLPENGSHLRDGEADFVVLVPGHGMVIIEVKGTKEFRVSDDERWHRREPMGGEVELKPSPQAQATRNMHQIAAAVVRGGRWVKFPGAYSYVVAYPNGEASSLPPMFDESTLLTQRHMNDLAGRLRHSLARRGPPGEHAFDAEGALEVARILTNQTCVVTRVDTGVEMKEDVEKVDSLTSQQFAALKGVFDLGRVGVVGPAGSGKTLLAIWRLRALLEMDRRALFVCFNKDLATVLRGQNPECADSIWSIDKFFLGLTGLKVPASSDLTRFFREELPSAAIDASELLPRDKKYDAILVDEGQDFSEDQLIALHELLRGPESQWVVFADWRQDLFHARTRAGIIGADVLFRLHHNCRNTVRVNDATNVYLGQHVDSHPAMPRGAAPVVEKCSSRDAMAKRATELASQWSEGRGVVVLSPYRLENSCLSGVARAHGMAITDRIEDFGKQGMLYFSTIRSFKGIEAAGIIVVDVDRPKADSPFSEEDFYVACTRPTARLAVLTTSNEATYWLGAASG